MSALTRTVFAAAAGLLSACSATLHQAETAPPPKDGFAAALQTGYAELARKEADENDFADADSFAGRALAAANGMPPQPELLGTRKLPSSAVPDLADAREKLVKALKSGATARMPRDAARAQLAFDCWMQEQEENIQPADIAVCREDFRTAMTRIDVKPLAVVAPARPAPVPVMLNAPMATAPLKTRFVVYFDFDSAAVAARSEAEISHAAEAARRIGAAMVRVTGHADRAGPESHNMSLSRTRARQVVEALRRLGLPEIGIATQAYGEEKPAVPTTNGAREPRNRRVEIELTH